MLFQTGMVEKTKLNIFSLNNYVMLCLPHAIALVKRTTKVPIKNSKLISR